MPGTRLILTVVFLVELLVILAAAVYFGLREDLILVPLLQQGGRDMLSRNDRKVSSQLWTLKALALPDQVDAWRKSVALVALGEESLVVDIQIQGDEERVAKVCEGRNENTSDHQDEIDLYLCSPQPGQRPHIGPLRDFHAASFQDLPRVLTVPRKPRSLDIFVVLERGDAVVSSSSRNRMWMEEVNEGLMRQNLDQWPCLWKHSHGSPPFSVRYHTVNLLPKMQRKVITDETTNSTTYEYQLMTQDVPIMDTTAGTTADSNAWGVTLYIPGGDRLVSLVDAQGKTSSFMANERSSFFAVLTENDSAETMNRVFDSVLTRCIGGGPESDSSSLFYWQQRLWMQRIYNDQIQKLELERQLLLNASRTVPVTTEVAQAWETAATDLEQVRHYAQEENYQEAWETLSSSSSQNDALLYRNPNLQEPIDFPMDHYAGVFVPLLIPLLLPALVGLVREWKTYRKKTRNPEKEKQD